MTRPSLIQNDTRPKTLHAEAPSPDLASWLTSDLRVKGAPSTPPPAESPSPPIAVVVVPESERGAEQSALGAWLTSDLRPRQSLPPEPPDSLAPQVVAPPPALDAAITDPGADLEADDFAVLPGRRGKRSTASRRARAVAAVALLLSAVGGFLFLADRPAPSHLESIAAAQAAAQPLGALPPPPPSELPPAEPLPESEPPPAIRAARSAEPAPPPLESEEDPLLGPRGRNWARYADLPLPTLSRLAREERELAKQRDEQRRLEARRAKALE